MDPLVDELRAYTYGVAFIGTAILLLSLWTRRGREAEPIVRWTFRCYGIALSVISYVSTVYIIGRLPLTDNGAFAVLMAGMLGLVVLVAQILPQPHPAEVRT